MNAAYPSPRDPAGRRSARQRRECGFTLVELLVALAIVAILLAMAMSGVQAVREKGHAAQCVSNLRQLATANLAYAADNAGSYVPAQEPSNAVRWHGTRGSLDEHFKPDRGPLAPYLGREGRVKLCPSLRKVLQGTDTFEEGTGGYGYNAVYIGGRPGDPYTPERIPNVSRPAQTVMFTDAAFPRVDGLQEYAYCEPWFWVDARGTTRGKLSASVHFRHSGKANVAWCDGHVTAEEPAEIDKVNGYGGDARKWKIGWFGPKKDNGYWRP